MSNGLRPEHPYNFIRATDKQPIINGPIYIGRDKKRNWDIFYYSFKGTEYLMGVVSKRINAKGFFAEIDGGFVVEEIPSDTRYNKKSNLEKVRINQES